MTYNIVWHIFMISETQIPKIYILYYDILLTRAILLANLFIIAI